MGDMGEVGDLGPQFHEEAGHWAQAQGIETLYTMGAQSALASQSFTSRSSGQGLHFDDIDALKVAILKQLPSVKSVLVKGSRFMKMERVVLAIQEQKKETQHAD